jgi:hypothetical protein
MKCLHESKQFPVLSVMAALAGACSLLAADTSDTPQDPAIGQRTFATPDEAAGALRAATQAQDRTALHQIFGPEFDRLLTGDAAQDAKNADRFAAAVAQTCKPVPDGQDTVRLRLAPMVGRCRSHWSSRTGVGISTRRRARTKLSHGTSGRTNSMPLAFAALTSKLK